MNTGTAYRIDEKTGTQIICNQLGVPKKKINSNITGRFNYEDRVAAMLKSQQDLADVEIPASLKATLANMYTPQL